MKSSLRCAIFDMDGLLFDTENLFLLLAEETEREIGYKIPRELHLEAIGRTFEDVRRIFSRELGEDFPYQEFFSRTKERVYRRIERDGMPIKEGVVECFAALKERGLPLILASSSPVRMIEKYLAETKMRGDFSIIVGGDEVEKGKPAPDIFLRAAEKAEAPPKDCIVFEDSNNGVRAAHAAGMRPVMIPDIREADAEVRTMAYRIYPSLMEAAGHMDELLDKM